MSMVEKLAEKWKVPAHSGGFMSAEDHARWWLNAVADELDAEAARIGRVVEAYEWQTKAAWLRAQAREDK